MAQSLVSPVGGKGGREGGREGGKDESGKEMFSTVGSPSHLQELGGVEVPGGWVSLDVLLGCLQALLLLDLIGPTTNPDKDLSIGIQDHHVLFHQILEGGREGGKEGGREGGREEEVVNNGSKFKVHIDISFTYHRKVHKTSVTVTHCIM